VNIPKTNPKNDRAKRDYLVWLKEAKQRSANTVEQARHAIDRFEAYVAFKDFACFNKEQAIAFKRALLVARGKRSGKPISIATVHHTLLAVKDFFAWLHGQSGYRQRIKASDIAYLNLGIGEERQARASEPKQYASLEDHRRALFAMPTRTEIERRDQAVMALLLLTSMRDAAVVTLKLRHVSLDRNRVFQNPREVKTKFRKTIETIFYPVGDDVVEIFRKWVLLLIEKGFTGDDPVFPKTEVFPGSDGNFVAQGIGRKHWASAAPVRKIFRKAFQGVGLPYFNPHSVRNTLTQLAYSLQLTAEEFKAWSQNMGHDKPLTTLNSYGQVSIERQAEIISGLSLSRRQSTTGDDTIADRIAEKVAAKLRLQ
jgi:integrase